MVREFMCCVGAAFLCGVAACSLRPHTAPDAGSYRRAYPSSSGRIEIALDAPLFIALGDTVHVEVTRYRCNSNVCNGIDHDWPSASSSWRVEPASAADVTERGQLIPRGVGAFRLTTARADTVLGQRIDVLPPVARFAWEPSPERVLVGDTIRANAVARDSSGRVVRIIAASGARARERSARFDILAWGGPNGTTVVALGPGVLELTARLGSRSAILRTVIDRQ
jgi:hypothetical protein